MKEILDSLGYMCKFFVSSRPRTDTCYGLPLKRPERLDPGKHYVIAATRSFEVEGYLKRAGFDRTDGHDCVCVDTTWHDDIIYRECFIGRGTYGYENFLSEVPDSYVKKIGRYCAINGSARAVGNHSMRYVTTHPLLYSESDAPLTHKFRTQIQSVEDKYIGWGLIKGRIEIGNDVWIGKNAVILPDVTIGDGAIIGAGAVVTQDVPPYAVMGGVPAKVIRYRFSNEMIASFMRIRWWEWPIDKVEENLEVFYQPELFCKIFDNDFDKKKQCE